MSDPYSVIETLHLTEKGAMLGEQANQYYFKVSPRANKCEIKAAVEQLFKVSVTNVNVQNYNGKRKRERTRKFGKRSDWKRAIVKLADGDRIDLT